MKKSFFIILTIFLFTSCGAFQMADVRNLKEGMTRAQVESVMGMPIRTIHVRYDQNGKNEAYEYRSRGNESYAVEFWNDRLVGYEFLYQDVPPQQVIPNRPPPPSYPIYPSQPNRPGDNNNRPKPDKPNDNKPTERPPANRPDNNNRPGTRPNYVVPDTKPAPTPAIKRDGAPTDENADAKK